MGEKEDLQSEIAQLQNKVYVLETAKKKVKKAKTSAEDQKKKTNAKTMKKNLSLAWKGNEYEIFCDNVDDLKIELENYIKLVDSLLDSIVTAKTNYEDMILDKQTILSGLWKLVNNIAAAVEKKFN